MGKHVDFYFTPLSPWTFLGMARFRAMVARHDAEVSVRPVDFGPIFARTGGLPLHQRPKERQAYRLMELKRWSAHLGVPLTLHPKHFPTNGELACWLILAAEGQAAQLRLTEAVGAACWQQERDIADPATLEAVANEAGLDGKALLARARQPDIAATRARFAEDAAGAGVFGAPTFVIEGELFWGQDRLDFVERKLAG